MNLSVKVFKVRLMFFRAYFLKLLEFRSLGVLRGTMKNEMR